MQVETVTRSGQLELEFRRDGNERTYVHRQFASYPFHVCRPHYFVGDPPGLATIYVQSLAGGIFDGDKLALTADFRPHCQAHLTTQASTIVHSMVTGGASQAAAISAGPESYVEYMPDPLILFPAANLTTSLRLIVHPTARVLLSDLVLFHDPAGRRSPFSRLKSETVLRAPDGRLLACDRFVAEGAETLAAIPGITGGFAALGSLFLVAADGGAQHCLASLRDSLGSMPGVYAGISELPNGCGIWARLLAREAHQLRAAIDAAWGVARRVLLGQEPRLRRK